MNDWILLTINDLEQYLIATQIKTLHTRVLGPNESDPLDDIISDVTRRIRADISGNPRNLLSQDETLIPAELKPCACYLVVEALQTRLPGLKLSSEQIRNADNARQQLIRISKGEIPVSRPLNPGNNPTYGPSASMVCVHSRPYVHNAQLRGL